MSRYYMILSTQVTTPLEVSRSFLSTVPVTQRVWGFLGDDDDDDDDDELRNSE